MTRPLLRIPPSARPALILIVFLLCCVSLFVLGRLTGWLRPLAVEGRAQTLPVSDPAPSFSPPREAPQEPVADPASPVGPSVLIRNVTVLDGTGPSRPGQAVLVVGRTIEAVRPDKDVVAPAGAEVVDGSGRFLIPGLWDMHIHLTEERTLVLLLASGVTGARHMYAISPTYSGLAARDAVRAGRKVGPRIVAADGMLDGNDSPFPSLGFQKNLFKVEEETGARAAVAQLSRRGNDFIKVHDLLPARAYFAAVAEAKEQRLPLVGHVPRAVSAFQAAEAGQRSLEHLIGVDFACSSQEEELRHQLTAPGVDPLRQLRLEMSAIDTFDEVRARRLFALFNERDTWVVPTLVQGSAAANLDDPRRRVDPRRAQLSLLQRAAWTLEPLPGGGVRVPLLRLAMTDEELRLRKRLFINDQKLTLLLHRSGVPLLAGTDSPYPSCYPGSGLHDELEELVRAGLTPAEALTTATSNPARFLGLADRLGTITPGKLADLVLLDADPLADIANVRRVHLVLADGKVYRPKELLAHGNDQSKSN